MFRMSVSGGIGLNCLFSSIRHNAIDIFPSLYFGKIDSLGRLEHHDYESSFFHPFYANRVSLTVDLLIFANYSHLFF